MKTSAHLLKRWAGALAYRLAINLYIFYGSLILAASLIAGELTQLDEVLWRSAAALGTAALIVGLVHACLEAHSASEGLGPHRRRRLERR